MAMTNGKAKGNGTGKPRRSTARPAFTDRQKKFVKEYLLDLNATQAAKRSGYSPKTATWCGPALLKKPHVAEAVAKEQARRARRTEIKADNILLEIGRIAFADIRRVVEFGPDGVTLKGADELSEEDAATIAEVGHSETKFGTTVHLRQHDKLRALRLAGEHLGLFKMLHEVSGSIDFSAAAGKLAAVIRKVVPAEKMGEVVAELARLEAEEQAEA